MAPASTTIVSACGEVVEIFERDGDLHLKVVLSSPTVLEVAAKGVGDLHLGDRVVIDGSFTVGRIRRGQGRASPPEP